MSVEEILMKLFSEQAYYNKDEPLQYSKRIERLEKVISTFFEELGYSKHILLGDNETFGKYNACVVYEQGQTPIAFQGHADVMFFDRSRWHFDPYGCIEDERVYGRGSSDMKGSIACLIHALRRISHKPTILITFDEEVGELTGFHGVRQGLKFLKEHDLMPEFILNLDGSELVPIKGRKGMMYCVLEFMGKAAHGSQPHKGDNAIYKASVAISAVEKYTKEKLTKIEDKELGNRTLNIGTIRGGDKVNQVPSWCIVELESRLISGENGGQEAEKVKTIIEKEGLVFMQDYRLELKSWQPAYVVRNPNNPYILAIRKALTNNCLNDELAVKSGFCEMNIIGNSGLPVSCLTLGVGVEEVAHADDEYIPIEQLRLGSKVYMDFITATMGKHESNL